MLIAGPNGAGKTTFARRYLPEDAGVMHFVNADLIASGLSPLKPELAAIAERLGELSAHLPPFGRQLGYVRQFGPCTTTIGEKSVKAKTRTKGKRPLSFAAGVGNALRRAAKDARKTARMYGTPLYVWENGKVVAKKP